MGTVKGGGEFGGLEMNGLGHICTTMAGRRFEKVDCAENEKVEVACASVRV